jgi:hypothetical protein
MGLDSHSDSESKKSKPIKRYFDGSEVFDDLKFKVLELGYKQIADELKRAEEQEHRVAFVVCSLLLVVGSWATTANPPASSGYFFPGVLIALGIFCILFTTITVGYLKDNGISAVLLFKDLIRVEEILGLHEPNNFITDEVVKGWEGTPFQEPRVFSSEGKSWALKKVGRGTKPHIYGVYLSGGISAAAIFVRSYILFFNP